VKSVQELIAYARAKPGELNYGSSGNASSNHLAGELFKLLAKVNIVHVPYKGLPQAVTDLIGGQIDLTFQPMPEALPYIKAGRVRTLAVTSPARSPSLPDIPTIAEAGVPGYAWMSWMGVAGPAGMPAALTAQISADWNRALTAGDMPARMLEMGVEVAGSTPEQFGAHMRSETEKMARLVKDAGIPLVE
jgi:tripartite-type tricarboxylate transporter receptor subunit TctC